MNEDFTNVIVGDEVRVSRGRSRDQISKVYHVTDQTFDVEGYGRFWKKNGKGHGDADSWIGRYAYKIEHGDRTRIAAENRRVKDHNLIAEHLTRHLNDDEMHRVATVIRECIARRNQADEDYAAQQDGDE